MTDKVQKSLNKYKKNNSINFTTDWEKMRDFFKIKKKEFLESYSYMTEEEYEATRKIVNNNDWNNNIDWNCFYYLVFIK